MKNIGITVCCSIMLVCMLAGCAQKEGKLPEVTPFCSMKAAEAQFTARVSQAPDLPLQGGVVLHPHGGGLGLITQHGRTLGKCTFNPEKRPAPDKENFIETGHMLWRCEPAPGMENAARLLARVVPAVYAGLCQGLKAQQIPPQEPLSALQPFRYEDTLGTVDIYFTNIVWP